MSTYPFSKAAPAIRTIRTAVPSLVMLASIGCVFTGSAKAVEPGSLNFTDVTAAPVGSIQTSNALAVTGTESELPISVLNGRYSIGCSGVFTAAPGTIRLNQIPVTVLAIGDSLTAGDVPESGSFPGGTSVSYRGSLIQALQARNFRVDMLGRSVNTPRSGGDGQHEGHGGAVTGPTSTTSNNIDTRIAAIRSASPNPQYITVVLGQNDIYNYRGADANAFTTRLPALLSRMMVTWPLAKIVAGVSPYTPYTSDFHKNSWFNPAHNALKALEARNPNRLKVVDLRNALTDFARDFNSNDKTHWTEQGAAKVGPLIANGFTAAQSVCVQHTASDNVASSVTTLLEIGGVTGSFTSTTAAVAPSVFQVQNLASPTLCLQPEDGAPSAGDRLSAKTCNVSSAAQRVTFAASAGGSFRMVINGLCVGSSTGSFADGTRLQLQACNGSSSQNFIVSGTRIGPANDPRRAMDLHAGNLSDVIVWNDYGSSNQRWSRVPISGSAPPPDDTTPDPFSFPSLVDVGLGSVQTSGTITVSGINATSPISIAGGAYSIGCTSTFATAASTLTNGQSVCLRHTASASNNTVVTTTLNIGGVTGSFSSTTLAGTPSPDDTTPDPFSFPSLVGVGLGSVQTSGTITVSGINATSPISISGGAYSIGCTGTFATAASTLANGQSVCLRHTASASNNTVVTTTLNIGGVTGSFSSTTLAGTPPSDPLFQVKNARNATLCLQPEDGVPSAGDRLSAKACNASSAAQRVTFAASAGGSFRMVINGLCVGSSTGSFADGTRLQLQACNGSSSQNFIVSGSRIGPANDPRRAMDLHAGNLSDVIVWYDYGSTNQRWSRVPR